MMKLKEIVKKMKTKIQRNAIRFVSTCVNGVNLQVRANVLTVDSTHPLAHRNLKINTSEKSFIFYIALICLNLFYLFYSILLYHIVLCSLVLYCIVLNCTILYCIILYCIVLYCIVLFSFFFFFLFHFIIT